eukprot:1942057-Amphidinium_carterae.1
MYLRACSGLAEPKSFRKNPEWQLVVGKRACKAFGEPFGPGVTMLPGQSVPEGVLRDNTSAVFGQVGTCSAGDVLGVTHWRSGGTRSAHTFCRVYSALSHKDVHAPFFDDELWLTEASAGKDAEEVHSSQKVAAFGEVDDIASLSTDCLTEALSSSDDDDFTWESLKPSKCPQAFVERGFTSEEVESLNGASTWKWGSTWKKLTETLRATLRLNLDGPAERNSAGARQS